MRPLVLPLVSLILASCDDFILFSRVCPPQCWVESTGEIRTDAPPFRIGHPSDCHLGTTRCEDGEAVECLSFVGPDIEERCDGLDNDCDGAVDENLDIAVGVWGNPCPHLTQGLCKLSEFVCVDGLEMCLPVVDIGPEVCDGLDNNCDGIVDDIPESYSYPSDRHPGTAGVGVCRPGVCRCIDGANECIGPVTPSREICSTGLDEDCDGFVDESEGPFRGHFVLAFDISYSMANIMDAVTDAACDWAADPGFDDSFFSIMLIADQRELNPYISILQDFQDSIQTCDNLLWLNENFLTLPSAVPEYQASSIIQAAALVWDPSITNRDILIFTDEPLQLGYSEELLDVQDTCLTYGLSVGVFTFNYYQLQWEPIISTCGGFTDALVGTSRSIMRDIITSHFSTRC